MGGLRPDPSGSLIVVPATIDDADAIAPLHAESWQSAYRGLLPDEFLDGRSSAIACDTLPDIPVPTVWRYAASAKDRGAIFWSALSVRRTTGTSCMTDRARLPWLLGIANGLLAVAAVDLVYTAMSSPGIWLVPMWLAVPYGAFTAWRASAYVRRLLNGSPSHVRPAVEGFALMALSTMAYGVNMAVRAGSEGAPFGTAMFLYAMYAVPVGCFGGFVAVALMLFDIGFVNHVRAARGGAAGR